MLEVTLYCIGKSPHLSMPVTGFLMLEKQGRLRITWELDSENRKGFPYSLILGAYVRGKRILFDMADGYGMPAEELSRAVGQSDFYFRRSFSKEQNSRLPKELSQRMYPLGFHYHVSCQGNFMDQVFSFSEWRKELFQIIFNGASRRYFTPERFECEPRKKDTPSVLFYTRLWDPEAIPALYESILKINRDRICLVRVLRNRYGSRFRGGIQYSPLALRQCRELVVNIRDSQRKRYLRAMREADICVGSTGLHGSIGWKTGEYIAGAKAIVNEAFQYQVPGDFQEGVHYLPFTHVEECIKQVDGLMEHPQEVYAMKCANKEYYEKYLRPDRLISNALSRVFPDFDAGR